MNNVFKKKSCDQKVNGEKYNNCLCILEKSEIGILIDFGYIIGNVFFCFFVDKLELELVSGVLYIY